MSGPPLPTIPGESAKDYKARLAAWRDEHEWHKKRPVKQYNNAIVEKAHDVRTLRPCPHCGGIGNADSMIARYGALNRADHYHGRCYIEKFGEASFFALPKDETNKMRLDDIGVKRMKRLVGTK